MTTTIPLTAHVLATISRAVRDLGLPAPTRYVVDGGRIELGMATRAEVDAWQRHVGLPPARPYQPTGEYGAIDFPAGGGWCGARVLTVSCPTNREEP